MTQSQELYLEYQTWHDLVDRVELRNSPFPMVLDLLPPTESFGHEVGRLIVMTTVPDRDTGEPRVVQHNYGLPFNVFWDDAAREAWLFERLELVMRHELAESYHLDGARVRDPHANDPEHLRPHP